MSEATMSPLLSTRGLGKQYGTGEGAVRALSGLDLDIGAGETVAITGPSGCGKSTLLHLLGGLDRPDQGEITVDGQRVDRMGERALARFRQRTIGFVFQSFYLLDELAAVENVELPAMLGGMSARAARARAEQLLERVGLADRATHVPGTLSGGQRQRVAVARALINEPLLVLADEPTGNLDSEATDDVLRLFDELHDAGQTLVIVTHDPGIAATAQRKVTLRDGVVVDDVRQPAGSMNGLAAPAGERG